VDDLFSSTAAPLRLETTIASPPRERPSSVVAVPAWAWVSRVRAAVTLVFFAGAAWWFLLPAWQILAFPAAGLACQCLRRWNALRWGCWSVTLAALGAGALVLGTWPLRFVACLLLVAPFVFFMGSQLRDV
jgi:hypothetical protein